ncbi:conserved hypothetical protein [Segniliparus rotundus DSM 44985]|uniref:Transmembrane protein n=1 Tax=Segniliparus rotundus (strain ATCC BAA-972 / CDC 1076 / CIP 108378 / DSM 44985 / JCM 13578) TaxID=640132 RepID=D6ZFH0_SEGRD|nr:DUF6159 family protein [Segniliparus rotundus]ADG97694.1 conserved hypothetical protein [Segniliparus rotundus DSM 44985]
MAAFGLAKQSWGVLREHPKLAWFPIIAILGAVVALVFDAVLFIVVLLGDAAITSQFGHSRGASGAGAAAVVLVILIATYLAAVVSSLCRAALIFETNTVLVNPNAQVSVANGFGGAFRRLPALLGWSAIQAVVGSVVSFVKDESSLLGGLVDLAWNVVSFLALPFLVLDGRGPVESLKLSSATLKDRWGDNLKLNLGLSSALVVAVIVIGLPAGGVMWLGEKAGWPILVSIAAIVGLICFAVVALVISTLTSILRTAFYRSVMDNQIPAAFAQDQDQQAQFQQLVSFR